MTLNILITGGSSGIGEHIASKFAVQGMIGALREELKGTQVKVGTINPGSVDTPWFKDFSETEAKQHRLDVNDVVDAAMMIIHQGPRSNIDHILIHPANSRIISNSSVN